MTKWILVYGLDSGFAGLPRKIFNFAHNDKLAPSLRGR
ncbi:hypothetical protein HFN_1112 [Helicobacter fennelliae MRY12-0050]|uniref:Uncharacterized protein n=1 Tax=Helicobacter fennelliae MRY12-0050 TaxID=1325130 RepID=T1DX15_9HELI|nr:hypothetical protein HFN_1112 [Helicobacter fennelliae MRY12-0050]